MSAPLDVILGTGQSIMLGDGNAAQSPNVIDPDNCLQWLNGQIIPANNPVGFVNTSGSGGGFGCVPALLNTYFAKTRRAVMFVQCAVGATAQQAAADTGAGNWDTSGTLLTTALNTLDAALNAAAAGWSPTFIGTLHDQGHQDAWGINANTPGVSLNGYKDALYNMVGRIQSAHPNTKFWISRLGAQSGPNGGLMDSPGFQQIRQGQEDMASYYHDNASAGVSNLRIVFRGGLYYPAHGLIQPDQTHYTQIGSNIQGRYCANAICDDGITHNQVLIEPVYPDATARIVITTD